jgi:hypothetical protein
MKQTGFNPNFFGKSPDRYPQNFGQLCRKAQHPDQPVLIL